MATKTRMFRAAVGIAATATASFAAGQPAPGGRPALDWATLPVFFHAANASGPWSPAAAEQIARFPMATIEKDHAMPLPGGGRQSEEIAGPAACRRTPLRIHLFPPRTPLRRL